MVGNGSLVIVYPPFNGGIVYHEMEYAAGENKGDGGESEEENGGTEVEGEGNEGRDGTKGRRDQSCSS